MLGAALALAFRTFRGAMATGPAHPLYPFVSRVALMTSRWRVRSRLRKAGLPDGFETVSGHSTEMLPIEPDLGSNSAQSTTVAGRYLDHRVVVEARPITVPASGVARSRHVGQGDSQPMTTTLEVRILVDGRDRLDRTNRFRVSFDPEGFDVLTFDGLIDSGDTTLAAAILDSDLIDPMGPGDTLALDDGLVSFASTHAIHRNAVRPILVGLVHMIDRLANAPRRDDGSVDVEALAEDVFLHDPTPIVRARCLDALLKSKRTRDHATDLVEEAKRDRSPAVRMALAENVPETALVALAEVICDQTIAVSVRLRALRLVLQRSTVEQLKPLLRRVIQHERGRIQEEAIHFVGRLGMEETLPDLAAAVGLGTATDMAIAQTAGVLGGPTAEDVLLTLLKQGGDRAKQAAAESLARVGTVRSLPPLQALNQAVIDDAGLRLSIEHALQQVRARTALRAPDASGALSLTSGKDTGQVSLVADSAGRLSAPLSDHSQIRRGSETGSDGADRSLPDEPDARAKLRSADDGRNYRS